jgi:serine protease Do
LNINGDLIGINTAIYAKAQGIGFAIPISKAKKIISDLIQHGEVIEAWIGVIVQNINAGLARYLGLRGNAGVMVKAVEADSPAVKSGIREGDVIVAVGDRRVVSDDDYQSAMRAYSPGHRLQMTIWREGKKRQIVLQARSYPEALAKNLGTTLLGIRVSDIDSQARRRYGIAADSGVFITEIDENAHLWRIGARQGDVIRRINELPIRNSDDFKRAMVKYRHKNAVVVLLQRGERAYYLTVDL